MVDLRPIKVMEFRSPHIATSRRVIVRPDSSGFPGFEPFQSLRACDLDVRPRGCGHVIVPASVHEEGVAAVGNFQRVSIASTVYKRC